MMKMKIPYYNKKPRPICNDGDCISNPTFAEMSELLTTQIYFLGRMADGKNWRR